MISKTISVKTLIVLLGPTGVGKTNLSLELAKRFRTEIISADSRQIYQEIPIGTAAPSETERAVVPHYLVGTHSIFTPYSVSLFEQESLALIESIHAKSDYALIVGGSMMYIDTLCHGIDNIPDVPTEIRQMVWQRYDNEGLDNILQELRQLDPIYYAKVDKQNYKRVLHGYEVCISTGNPFSSFHSGIKKDRPWRIIKIGLTRERPELYDRINKRVLQMIDQGLVHEAKDVYPHRHLNALNTVGYKELFEYFDNRITLDEAIRKIQKNSRVYARKQFSWWKRDKGISWFHPSQLDEICAFIEGYALEIT